ncbi:MULTISPECIES: AraC family transcriptional regulator [Paenibacillus]|uniref:AraC-like DNA-binding protein n=1 Tax=Paenibacillus pabuli TaxID=1472 RepID=A0A855Y4Y2_9BACL|nr:MULTISPECIES: AraC family transcriptional regulator [Paenibacillus]PWW36695.1 AraC-like DNA-binding protein [Paenibacillus pabuli]PXW04198.1 AraC-like DNA-binding protein [Paenibacillus taichungensis]RAJ00677.1 AraC-like DNA-binding protein [Paenibacillus pabuli]
MITYMCKNNHFQELQLLHYGTEACAPGHHFGPAMRDYYKIHYILDGKGTFEVGGKKVTLRKGQGFLIVPHSVVHYEADQDDPWEYSWVAFQGSTCPSLLHQACLSEHHPIFELGNEDDEMRSCLHRMISSRNTHKGWEISMTGLLFQFFSILIDQAGEDRPIPFQDYTKETYVTQVMDFIEINYANTITVQSIASHVGLQRSYLCSLFKDKMGTSIQSYLVNYRMRRAAELTLDPALTIGDISRSVGYADQLLFSKMFKKVMGEAPTYYRKHKTAPSPLCS